MTPCINIHQRGGCEDKRTSIFTQGVQFYVFHRVTLSRVTSR